jgi:hypothetical protein
MGSAMEGRGRSGSRAAVWLLVLALLLPAPVARAADFAYVGGAVFDVLILRPLGVATVLVGAAAFVPAVIVTSPQGSDGILHAYEVFVEHPVKHAFTRPLGEW